MLCRICRKQQAARANALAHAALTSVRTSAIRSVPRCLRKTVFANVIASRSFACRGPDTGSAKANGFPKHRQRTSPSFTDTCAGIQGGQHMFCMQMGVTRRSPHGRLRGSNLILECHEGGGGDFLEPIEQHEEGEPRWEERERGADACSSFNLSGSFGVPEVQSGYHLVPGQASLGFCFVGGDHLISFAAVLRRLRLLMTVTCPS